MDCTPAPAPTDDGFEIIRPEFFEELFNDAVIFVIRLLVGIVVYIIGRIIIAIIMKIIRKILSQKKNLDETLRNYALSVIKFVLNVILFLIVIDVVGINVVSLGAIFGALVIAIGLSLSGMMANFVAGITILVNKPYVVKEMITSQGYTGVVQEIAMMATTLTTADGKTVIMPNGPIASSPLTNFTRRKARRVDLVIGVDYGCDLSLARQVLKKVCHDHEKVLKKPATVVEVCELAANSVNFVVRPWAKTSDYWTVYFQVQEFAKNALDDAGIGIPFAQRDVHIVDADPSFGFDVPSNEPQENEEEEEEEESSEEVVTEVKSKKKKKK